MNDDLNDDDNSELQLLATVPTTDDEIFEVTTDFTCKDDLEEKTDLTNIETKWDEYDDDDIDPNLLCRDLKDTLFINVKQCEQTHMEYARAGFDMKNLKRFQKLTAALVVQKEAEIARSREHGNEKDVIMEESIECVPKSYLEDFFKNESTKFPQLGHDALRIISVGELLSLLEV
jgi:hypothetical protein